MSAAFRPCTAEDSGWRPDAKSAPDFRCDGRELTVELKRWTAGDIASIVAAPGLTEEMGAVLEGRFELSCEDERYELNAGDGLLIPASAPRTWRLLSESGVLYRVFPR